MDSTFQRFVTYSFSRLPAHHPRLCLHKKKTWISTSVGMTGRHRWIFDLNAAWHHPVNRTAWIGGRVFDTQFQLSPWSSVTQRLPVVEPNARRSPVESIASA